MKKLQIIAICLLGTVMASAQNRQVNFLTLVKCEHRSVDGSKVEVRLSSDVFVRGVFIAVDDDVICDYTDNYFDLLPGEQRAIIIMPRSAVKMPFNPNVTIRHL